MEPTVCAPPTRATRIINCVESPSRNQTDHRITLDQMTLISTARMTERSTLPISNLFDRKLKNQKEKKDSFNRNCISDFPLIQSRRTVFRSVRLSFYLLQGPVFLFPKHCCPFFHTSRPSTTERKPHRGQQGHVVENEGSVDRAVHYSTVWSLNRKRC